MTEPEAGTPGTEPQTAKDAGTAAPPVVGSEAGEGKPVDFKLAMDWKSKAEEVNKVRGERDSLQARLEELERRQYAPSTNNPLATAFQEVSQYAASGDPQAQLLVGTLQALDQMAKQQTLTSELMAVPENLRESARQIVMQSNFTVSVAQAAKLARGPEYDGVAKRAADLEAENKTLRDKLESSRRVVSTSTMPVYGEGVSAENLLPASEYNAILKRGGQAAIDLKKLVQSGSKVLEWDK